MPQAAVGLAGVHRGPDDEHRRGGEPLGGKVANPARHRRLLAVDDDVALGRASVVRGPRSAESDVHLPNTPAVLRPPEAVRADRAPVADGLERRRAASESADDEVPDRDRDHSAVPALDAAVGLEHAADHEVARLPSTAGAARPRTRLPARPRA